MITFETQLKRLKYEAIERVIKLAKEGTLSKKNIEKIPYEIIKGNKPLYRCCVHKERAIVFERAKLAMGCLPNGEMDEELKEANSDDQVMYVIEAACDRCPINRFTVTEACRGCIQHKCMEVCPANAITRVNGRAYINQELCRECGMCKKVCPYNAISEVMRPCKKSCPTGALDIHPEDRIAMINEEDCINCGACMAACPFGAISDISYVVPVTKALVSDKKVYAVVAPAITGQFGPKVTVGQIKDAFNKLGFVEMFEAACGADAVTVHESNEFVERIQNGDKYMVNSCCSGLVNYIEKKFPSEVSKVSGTVSPMIATAKMIKDMDKEAVVVFIGPCTAKKSEMKRPDVKGIVDYVMTFEEFAALMGAFDIDPEQCEDVAIDDASLYGRNFAQSGGLTSAIKNYVDEKGVDVEFKPFKASGGAEIKKAMMLAKVGRLPGNFIEGMMCEGGCIGGAATMVSQQKTKVQLNKFSKASSKQTVLSNDNLEKFKEIDLEREEN
ncbi:4Fe-4S dicluster domain-containing protein [Haloimpatiens sp. FM7330]|uniref:4Fe-4S dicluster domain-containing protein n=1 Tax=Haloimpatiens sp. FM7330 TaxID=3298610 RepID=UPI00362588C5